MKRTAPKCAEGVDAAGDVNDLSHRCFKAMGKRVDMKRLFTYGTVEYRDVLNRDRTTGFCWELALDSLSFQPTANMELNYLT